MYILVRLISGAIPVLLMISLLWTWVEVDNLFTLKKCGKKKKKKWREVVFKLIDREKGG